MDRKHIVLIAAALFIILSAVLTACSTTPSADTEQTGGDLRKVIIDTDTGADDASALILAVKSGKLDILGVTTLVGNVDLEQSTRNALAALETAGSDAPVYNGSSERYKGKKIEAFSVFGSDGMGDAGIVNTTGKAEETDAIDFILETVKKYPNEVEIIALGPVTNIAKAIEREPETMQKVKMIWSMGTAGFGHGNASPVAEFNTYADPDAYKIMLDSGINITIIGLDMCNNEAMWTGSQFEKLKSTNSIGEFVTASFSKIRDFYKSNGFDDSVMNCDTLAMMCVLYPDFVNKTIQCHGSCITDEGETYAQVIFYKKGFTYDAAKNDFDYNVTLVNDVDKADYFDLYLKAIK